MLAEQTAEIERIVIPHSAYKLENALHLDELPRVRYTWVRIAAKQMGVGGDDSWGAPVHEEYCIPADQPMTLQIIVEPLQCVFPKNRHNAPTGARSLGGCAA